MTNWTDDSALQQLLPYVEEAIDAQPVHVADQLRAAFHDGKTQLRIDQSAVAPVVVVLIDGYEVAEVDVRNLLPD